MSDEKQKPQPPPGSIRGRERGYEGYPPRMEPEGPMFYYYLRVLQKRSWLILSFTFVGAMIALLMLANTRRAYQAMGQLLFIVPATQSSGTSPVSAVDYAGLGNPEWGAYMPTQIELLKGRGLAESSAKKLSLADKWEFEPEPPGLVSRITSTIKSWIKGKVETTDGKETSTPAEADIAGAIVGRIGVRRVEDSRIVEVTFTGKNPERVVRILDTLMETFIEQDVERRYRSASEVLDWLRGQQRELQSSIEQYEGDLQNYVEEEKLAIAPHSEGDRDTVDTQKLDALSQGIIAATARRIQAETIYDHLKKDGTLQESSIEGPEGEALRKLKAERALLSSSRNALAEKFGEKWPEMQDIDARLSAVNKEIQVEMQKVLASAKAGFEVVQDEEGRLKAELEQQKQHTITLKRKGVKYRMLKREIEANEKMFDMLLKSAKEASVAEKIDRSQVVIAARARLAGEVSSNKAKAMSVGVLFLVVFAGVGLAFVLEQGDPRIETEDEVEELIQMPLFGSIARLSKDIVRSNGQAAPLVTKLKPHSLFAEQFRGLSANALAQAFDRDRKTLLVTSTLPREGKTIVCSNLAICLAQLGKKVLLIDSDTRKSAVHRIFEIENKVGFAELVRHEESDISAAIQATSVPNLWVMTAGHRRQREGRVHLMDIGTVRKVLFEVSKEFDAVIIDTAPVGVIADGLNLSAAADCVLVVFRSGVVTKRMAQRSIQQLSNVGAKLIGAVLNDVYRRGIGYRCYYYYPYRYYGYHKYYEGSDHEEGKRGKPKEEGTEKRT